MDRCTYANVIVSMKYEINITDVASGNIFLILNILQAFCRCCLFAVFGLDITVLSTKRNVSFIYF